MDEVGVKRIKKKAWNSIRGQRYRCNNPNATDYKYYGGKGISVEYSTKEFYDWYFKSHCRFKLEDKVSVDRINHDKNYSLDNIQLILHRDNCSESNRRRSLRKYAIYRLDTGKLLHIVDSFADIARVLNINKSCLYENKRKNRYHSKKYNIRWEIQDE